MTYLADRMDWQKVQALALHGAQALAETDPLTARRILRAIELMGGAAIHVGRWDDDIAAIKVNGVTVWTGDLQAILTRLD